MTIKLSSIQLLGSRVAVFSDCMAYRYRLSIRWDTRAKALAFLMLNPSTADHEANDPTVGRCEKRARALGYGGAEIINLFAVRSPDPAVLRANADPIGPDNDAAILECAREVDDIVVAWGSHGSLYHRRDVVLDMLRAMERAPRLYCLGVTSSGEPRHPLYIADAASLIPFTETADHGRY